MRGVVEIIGRNGAMIGVNTEEGEFSVIELIGGYSPRLGDIISGDLEGLGSESVWNLTQGEKWDVFIQDIHGSRESAQRLIDSV